MTAEDEIQRLDARVTRLETAVFNKLEVIEGKINNLAVAFAAKRDCPDPGACISLTARVNEARDLCIQSANRIARLERWQYGVMAVVGALSIIGPSIVAFATFVIKIHFKL